MSKAVPALFLAFVAAVLAYAFAHRQGPPLPATEVRIDTTMVMSASPAGAARVAVGERGRIFRQEGPEAAWQVMKSPTESTLTRVRFLNERLGLAVGHDQVILRTEDGGKIWKQVFSDAAAEAPLLDVIVLDAQRAIAIGAYGLYLESADGGQSWTSRFILPEGEDRHLNGIATLADGTLLIAGEAGTILRSTDAGLTWGKVASPYEGSYFGIQPVSASEIVIYGMRGKLMRSEDAGQTFTEISHAVPTSLFGSSLASDGRLLVVGQSGELLSSADSGRSFTRYKIDGSPMLSAVLEGAGPGRIHAFGEKGLHAARLN